MWWIARVRSLANARSAWTSSPGCITTASRASWHATTKPFLKNGPTARLSIIMMSNDTRRSRRPDVHVEDQDDRQQSRGLGDICAIGGQRFRRDAQDNAEAG